MVCPSRSGRAPRRRNRSPKPTRLETTQPDMSVSTNSTGSTALTASPPGVPGPMTSSRPAQGLALPLAALVADDRKAVGVAPELPVGFHLCHAVHPISESRPASAMLVGRPFVDQVAGVCLPGPVTTPSPP